MKKKNLRWAAFSSILIFYALLYAATTKVMPCEGNCPKINQVSTLLMKRPYVYGAFNGASDTTLMVLVNDSVSRNWPALADTACTYLKNVSLNNFTVFVLSYKTSDTLAKTKCP